MIVMPFTCAFTSRRRFTLLKVFRAAAIAFFGTSQDDANAAAAVAFQTLYSPAKANSRSAQGCPLCRTVHDVRAGSRRRFVIFQFASGPVPYCSTGQKALAKQRSRLGEGATVSDISPVKPSKATIRPRRGTRFTRRLKAVSTASRSL